MSVPSFAERREAWSSLQLDDIGYLPATDLLAMGDDQFALLMQQVWTNRYTGPSNWRGRWVEMFGMHDDGFTGCRILDYGCGVGMEGAQYANLGNEVWLADINAVNLGVAERLFGLYGRRSAGKFVIKEEGGNPGFDLLGQFDVIHCVQTLDHIPEPVPVVDAMHSWLAPGGRLHLVVYSDRAWRKTTGTEAPAGPVEEHPEFERFWRTMDPVGGYADWYDKPKLKRLFGEWFFVDNCQRLSEDGTLLGAVLLKR